MNREICRKILENGGSVDYHVWTFYDTFYDCNNPDCDCYMDFESIDDALDTIELHCHGDWEKVFIINE